MFQISEVNSCLATFAWNTNSPHMFETQLHLGGSWRSSGRSSGGHRGVLRKPQRAPKTGPRVSLGGSGRHRKRRRLEGPGGPLGWFWRSGAILRSVLGYEKVNISLVFNVVSRSHVFLMIFSRYLDVKVFLG